MLSVLTVLLARCLMVGLFLPFSALDKLFNFGSATAQAGEVVRNVTAARLLILGGFCVEVLCSAAILAGLVDRLAAAVLAIYCVITAVLWKQFWNVAGFKLRGPGGHRDLFWDFLKNLALGGGFLLLALGGRAEGVRTFISHPLASSHPYAGATL